VPDRNADGVFLRAILAPRGNYDDVELTELRYSGKPAAFLRGLKIHLSRLADELLHPGLGNARDGDIIAVLLGPAIAAGRGVADYSLVIMCLCITR